MLSPLIPHAGELESLLYTLVYWACEGTLHWGHALGYPTAAALKYDAMHRQFEVGHAPRMLHASLPVAANLSGSSSAGSCAWHDALHITPGMHGHQASSWPKICMDTDGC